MLDIDIQIPIVAAINGRAMGLGASVAPSCDIVFVAESARIGDAHVMVGDPHVMVGDPHVMVGDPHVMVGVVAGDGGTFVWPLAVGPALAKQYLLTGDPIEAAEAHRIGLVNFVTPHDGCSDQAIGFARCIAANAPMAVQYTKLAVNELRKDAANTAFDVATALETIASNSNSNSNSNDHAEPLAAIAEKRTPIFESR